MDNRYQFMCKNLVLFFAILFAVLVVVQHFELPYGRELLPSLLSPKVLYNMKSNYSIGGESSDFVSVGNQSLKGDLGLVSSNQTSNQNNVKNRGELKDDRNSVSNGTQEKPMDTEHTVSLNGFTERGNFPQSSNRNGSSDSSLAVPQAIPASNINPDSNKSTPVTSAERNTYSRPKDVEDGSSTDVKPLPLEGNFRGSTMKVMPISKMNEFLHQSYSSPHSLVGTITFDDFMFVSEYGI